MDKFFSSHVYNLLKGRQDPSFIREKNDNLSLSGENNACHVCISITCGLFISQILLITPLLLLLLSSSLLLLLSSAALWSRFYYCPHVTRKVVVRHLSDLPCVVPSADARTEMHSYTIFILFLVRHYTMLALWNRMKCEAKEKKT